MSDRQSILQIVPTFPPDPCGVADHTFQLCWHLQRDGHSVAVLTTRREREPTASPIEILPLISSWGFQEMQSILEATAAREVDVVHIQYHNEDYDSVDMISVLPAYLREALPGARIVTTLHNTRSSTFSPKLTLGVMLRFSDQVVLTNEEDLEVVRKEFPRHAHKCSVIPAGGGMPCPPELLRQQDRQRARLRNQLELQPDTFLLGYFGFINEEKGLESLVHCMEILRREGPATHLLLIGGPHTGREHTVTPYQRGLLERIRSLELGDRITGTGYLPAERASSDLLGLDLAVLPFQNGLTTKRSSLLSVLSHNIPALSTRGPHLPEAFRHAENVFLVPAGGFETTGQALADAVRALAPDRKLLETIRSGGTRLFETAFSWDSLARAHHELYRQPRVHDQPVAPANPDVHKLHSLQETRGLVEGLRRAGKTIVLAGGCFDLLHVGHVRYLKAARARGDCLVVALNSDESARKLKGPGRPLLNETERAEILSEFPFVDFIVVFPEETAATILRELKPHYYAKGSDYAGRSVPGTDEFLRHGGELLFVGDEKTRSSTGYWKSLT